MEAEKKDSPAPDPDGLHKLQQLFSKSDIGKSINMQNPVGTIRNLTSKGSLQLVDFLLNKVNMESSGGQLLQAAVEFEQPKILEEFIKKGASVRSPPETVAPVEGQARTDYRKAPFAVQAAKTGNTDILQRILDEGAPTDETGCIALNRKTQLISNALGAACYHGRLECISLLLERSEEGLN